MKTALPFLLTSLAAGTALAATDDIAMDVFAKPAEVGEADFQPNPIYSDAYNVDEQLKIYGDKRTNENPRPLLELGRRIYDVGPIPPSGHFLGKANPTTSQFILYGDARIGLASNTVDNSALPNDGTTTQAAARLNLDADWKITSTERIHVSWTPLEDGGRYTRQVFSAPVAAAEGGEFEFDGNVDAAFFEGDLGALVTGATGTPTTWDLPFAIGRIPLQFHNGIWLDDAFDGLSFTIPARHSKALDISNFDVTFFGGNAAWDSPLLANATSGGNVPLGAQQDDVTVFGVNAFLEANAGYWEIGLASTDDGTNAIAGYDQSYLNFALSFTRRYADRLSNSLRLLASVGQEGAPAGLDNSADGVLVLVENSLVTSSPSTVVPYFNLFYGVDRPQSVARATGTGGILRNTGILFESDGLTGYPTLDDSGFNTHGIAVGVQNLFALDQQLVVELAWVDQHDSTNSAIGGQQVGLGVRYQRPFSTRWIFRADAMVGQADGAGGASTDLSGVRAEWRVKF